MNPFYFFYFYIGILFMCSIVGCLQFRKMDETMHFILFFIVLTTVNETGALIYVKKFHGASAPIYHIYTIFALIIVTVYYLKFTRMRDFKKIFLLSIILWPTVGLINLYWQPLSMQNSNMIILESIVIIIMALHCLYKILINDSIVNVRSYPHFWVWSSLVILWCGTFFFWAFFNELVKNHSTYKNLLLCAQIITNIIGYAGIGGSFLLYSKSKENG